MKIRELLAEKAEIVGKINHFIDKEERSKLTSAEQKEVDVLMLQAEGLQKKIETRQRLLEIEKSKPAESHPLSEKRSYSLAKAIRSLITGKTLDGFEAEVSKELEKRTEIQGDGVVVPVSAFFGSSPQKETRTVTNQTALFSDPVMPSEIVPALREQTLVGQLGLKMLTVQGRFNFPKITGSQAGWFKADGTDSITDDDPTFGSISSTPKFLGVTSSWSIAQLKNQTSDISLEMMIRDDLTAAMSEKLDEAIVKGTGQNQQPTGILNQSGIGKTTKAYQATPSWTIAEINNELKELRASYKNNISMPKWLLSSTVESEWRSTQKWTNSNDSLLDAAKGIGEVKVTNWLNQPATPTADDGTVEAILAQWDNYMLISYGALMIQRGLSGSDFTSARDRLRVIGCWDLILRRPEGFRFIQVDRKA